MLLLVVRRGAHRGLCKPRPVVPVPRRTGVLVIGHGGISTWRTPRTSFATRMNCGSGSRTGKPVVVRDRIWGRRLPPWWLCILIAAAAVFAAPRLLGAVWMDA